jgi:hypothetical protein
MIPSKSTSSPWQTPGISHYLVVGLVSVSVIWLVLMRREISIGLTLFPVLAGTLGLTIRWRLAPAIMLTTLAVCLKLEYVRRSEGNFRLTDVVLCGATLAYLIAQYRLQSIMDHVFPIDSRRREGPPRWHVGLLTLRYQPEIAKERRSPQLVTREEIGMLILVSIFWAALAQVFWNVFPWQLGNPDFPPRVWRAILLTWFAGASLYVVFNLLQYWSRKQMSPDEAMLFLQDELWKETRREQRRSGRWLAWTCLRLKRKKA